MVCEMKSVYAVVACDYCRYGYVCGGEAVTQQMVRNEGRDAGSFVSERFPNASALSASARRKLIL